MLDEKIFEQRLATLEHMVADLKRRIDGNPTSSNWLEKVTGSISDDEAFLAVLEYGKSWRYTKHYPTEDLERECNL